MLPIISEDIMHGKINIMDVNDRNLWSNETIGTPDVELKGGGTWTSTPNISIKKDILGFDNGGPSGRAVTVGGGMESIRPWCVFVRENVNPPTVCLLIEPYPKQVSQAGMC